ncbi:hypothetical protein Tco_0523681 [Tanacetum coccineum]
MRNAIATMSKKHALICTFLKESSGIDHKLHLSMYGEATQLEKQMGAKLAWLREKYSYCTREGLDEPELSESIHDPQNVCLRHIYPSFAIMIFSFFAQRENHVFLYIRSSLSLVSE